MFEGGTGREVVFGGVVVDVVREFWDGSVACVAVVWFLLVPVINYVKRYPVHVPSKVYLAASGFDRP